jgi:endo-1,3-1,4-beta-glycanase ExoK
MGLLRSLSPLVLALACSKGTAPPVPSTLASTITPAPAVPPSNSSNSSTSPSNPSNEQVEPFRLLYRDEFETLDPTRWQLMTHSWGGNLAVFSDESPLIEDSQLKLRLLSAPEGTRVDGEDKAFLGAEVRSRDTLTYGRVRARARFAKAPAVVSSLVTIYTPWPADNWNELDIESLGQDPNQVQFNSMVYTGPEQPPTVTESVTPTADPFMEVLGFDSSLDFHEYTIEWTPESATFWVDGEQRHVWTKYIDSMTLPQNVLLTIWASDSPGWAGEVGPETTGATVTYDWVELWEYTGQLPESPVADTGDALATDGANTDDSNVTPATSSIATSGVASDGNPSEGVVSSDRAASDTDGRTNDEGASVEDGFVLMFRDDFEQLDSTRWELMTHSWDSNLALFSSESVKVLDGFLTLTLLDAPSGTTDDTGATKTFLGAEVRSKTTIDYGRVRARAKFSNRSAVVSALVTIYTPWPADNWNELDIEHLGVTPDRVQFNTMVYTGEPVALPAATSVTPTQFPELVELGFDASVDFHEYELEWTPQYVRFAVDGEMSHEWTEHVALLGLPQNVLLTIWASASPDWAGDVTAETSGAEVVYDWVEVYAYTP